MSEFAKLDQLLTSAGAARRAFLEGKEFYCANGGLLLLSVLKFPSVESSKSEKYSSES